MLGLVRNMCRAVQLARVPFVRPLSLQAVAVNKSGGSAVWSELRSMRAAASAPLAVACTQAVLVWGERSVGQAAPLEADSVMRKRRTKMKKHKWRKRRKAQRAERRKLSQGR
ncbi:ACL153Cp [Eremothecium gossypii ATCC 10895]|uniref:Small ribosomal subunit protein mS38 n=1 Tax=Eremothecium gossypii (strain ATCC 10895 / CBS 109.51 / FGSC 9923 / NRRL Y-1056) TaxID=284811 RepID=Q75CS2_EREGS|nr:ACL153Cp [Eremothecium gossypii ATCC 10895]AAS51075.1 ACL153Cp [Eremothecium gossypii ATCC 10895]AEY95365.1 FACL153Cp [Eremothecium gossypii FDAG1]